jgi:hypothetical protein
MHFDQFIQYRALAFKFDDFKASDHALENPELVERLKLRTVCTALVPSVFDDLDQLCNLLEIPKRRFAELALIEAVEKAKVILEQVNAFEFARQPRAGESV